VTLQGNMSGCIQRECAFHYGIRGQVHELIVAYSLVGSRIGGQDEGFPPEPGEVAREADRPLDAAASDERREVEGDHQKPLHRLGTPGIQISTGILS
jgi:hypothetical protein